MHNGHAGGCGMRQRTNISGSQFIVAVGISAVLFFLSLMASAGADRYGVVEPGEVVDLVGLS